MSVCFYLGILIIKNLPDTVSEIGVVIGYLGEKIIQHLENKYPSRNISFFFQKENRGTAHALFLVKEWVHKDENFLVLLADNTYNKNDLSNLISRKRSIGLIIENLKSQKNHTLVKNDFISNIQPVQENQTEVTFSIGAYYLD